jgi:hypothetical protein
MHGITVSKESERQNEERIKTMCIKTTTPIKKSE